MSHFSWSFSCKKIFKKSKTVTGSPMQNAGLPTLGVAWDSVALERTSEGHQECPSWCFAQLISAPWRTSLLHILAPFAPWPSQTPSPSHTIQHRRRQTPQWKELCVPTWELGLDCDVHISYPKNCLHQKYAIMGCTWCYWFYKHFLWLSWILRRWGTELPAYAISTAAPHMSMPSSLSVPQAVPCFPNTFQCFPMLSPAATVVSVFAFVRQYDKLLLLLCDFQTFRFFHWMIIQPMGCSGKDCNKPPRKRPCLSKGCLLPATILEVQATLAMERSREIKEAQKCKGISNTMQMHKNRHSKDTILLKK